MSLATVLYGVGYLFDVAGATLDNLEGARKLRALHVQQAHKPVEKCTAAAAVFPRSEKSERLACVRPRKPRRDGDDLTH